MTYSDLPSVSITEQDKTITPDTSIGSLYMASVLDCKWGNPDITLYEKPQEFVDDYTIKGIPDVGDTMWFSAYHMLNNGVPLYLKRVVGSDARCANVVYVSSGSTGTTAGDASGITWDSSYSFEGDQLFVIHTYPGAYGEAYGFKVTNINQAEYEFDLEIYRKDSSDTYQLLRTITLSRKHKVDGFGNQLYLEERIKESGLPLRIIDNTSIADTVLPEEDLSTVDSDGGIDGTAISTAMLVSAWEEMKTSEYDFRVNLSLSSDTSGTIAVKVMEVANARKYNIAVVDTEDVAQSDVSTWRGTVNASDSRVIIGAEYFKYQDSFNGVIVKLPPSVIIGELISRNRDSNPFKSIAGLRRGTFSCLGLSQKYTDTEMNELLKEQVNPLGRLGGTYTLIDERTALNLNSVLKNLHVRFLYDYISETAENYLITFLHEFNDENTRETVQDGIQRVLDRLVDSGDLIEGVCQCNEDNNPPAVRDAEELVVDIYLKVPRTAKFIKVRLIGLPSGQVISELI